MTGSEPVDQQAQTAGVPGYGYAYCSMKPQPERTFPTDVAPERSRLIRLKAQAWVNGTVLHYYFFNRLTDGETHRVNGEDVWFSWVGTEAAKNVVREAFARWKDVGIGLEFVEVQDRSEAEIRIGFMEGDGAWSFLGRDVLNRGPNERTMNFGWDITRSPRELDTAIHEIGHTLGFPHEHQNPNAGIVWNEEAVYRALAGPPNNWPRQQTFYNIIRKLDPNELIGSNWDPDSVMHYPFEAGLILSPPRFVTTALVPKGGLSPRDKEWVRQLYPPLTAEDYVALRAHESVKLNFGNGEQANFRIEPEETRVYQFRTFGESDVVMVLFETIDGQDQYVAGDDDAGERRNATLEVKLFKSRSYVLRLRKYFQKDSQASLMMW